MRYALAILVSVSLAACADGGATSPTPARPTPIPWTPPPGYLITVQVVVVNNYGSCVEGATVQIVRGQRAGERVEQVTPCDAWEIGNGATFRDVVSDTEMTFRASAPGYADTEQTIIASFGRGQFVVFVPSPL